MDKEFYDEDFFETKKELKALRKIRSRRDRSKFKLTNTKKREKREIESAREKLSKMDLLRGRVLALGSEEIFVAKGDEIYTCVLKGALKQQLSHMKNLITVGDFVLFEVEQEKFATIVHIVERHSVLSRQEHLRRRQKQLIAANIDQVLITVSVGKPPLKPSLVDRYIISTYKGAMQPVIIVNKIDLLEQSSDKDLYELFLNTYRALDIPVISVSTVTKEGLDSLKKQMQDRSSVFSGQSGVGKSSLINAVCDLNLSVGDVVEKTSKGSHTTTSARLIPLKFGGFCIDTPGIRSFGIWDLKKEDLTAYFPEIDAISHLCKYPNCTHSHEPGCAIEQALLCRQVSPLRLDSYLKLLKEVL